MSERQVDQETVAIVQPAEDECRKKGIEDGRRYAVTNALQLRQGGKAARHCLLHMFHQTLQQFGVTMMDMGYPVHLIDLYCTRNSSLRLK